MGRIGPIGPIESDTLRRFGWTNRPHETGFLRRGGGGHRLHFPDLVRRGSWTKRKIEAIFRRCGGGGHRRPTPGRVLHTDVGADRREG